MFIRQVALVARELRPVVDDLCAVFGIRVSFNDPGVGVFGLENAVMPVGGTFLEVVAPVRPEATAARYLERRKGDGGYMVILQSEDLEVDRRRLAERGVRVVWETTLPDISTIHLHPRDVGGAIVSLDQPQPPDAWRWAGPNWEAAVRSELVRGISGVEIQSDDPQRLARRWAEVLGTRVEQVDEDCFSVVLARGRLWMVTPGDNRGEGISAIYLDAVDRARILRAATERGCLFEGNTIQIGGVSFLLTAIS